jgi:hypothetical protein
VQIVGFIICILTASVHDSNVHAQRGVVEVTCQESLLRVPDGDGDGAIIMRIMHSLSITLSSEKSKRKYPVLHILQEVFVDIMKVTHNQEKQLKDNSQNTVLQPKQGINTGCVRATREPHNLTEFQD